jgi:hypothetical protein
MKSLSGDEKLAYLKDKINNKVSLTPEDILTLTFLPLMRSSESKSSRALQSIDLAASIKNENNKIQCLSMLYALFEKFGDELSKKRFKEAINSFKIFIKS